VARGGGRARLGNSCHICTWVKAQPIPVQEEWHTELAKPAEVVSHMSVLRALERRGVDVIESGVKRHRRNHA
jgi:hypothetical protein